MEPDQAGRGATPDVPDTALGRRDRVVVEGPDAADYLQSQVSQDLRGLAVGGSRWTFVLEPGGKVVSLARVRRVADERFELDTDAGFGAGLLARLDRFKIRVKAATSLDSDAFGATRDDALRIAIGWPAMGAEIVGGETIPAATGLAPIAVSFTKGCYPGQELVERMDSRSASAPRTLRRLAVGAATQPGDPVVDGGEEVGIVTSVADGLALAWIKRTSSLGEPVEHHDAAAHDTAAHGTATDKG